jgi:carbonic anhydrase
MKRACVVCLAFVLAPGARAQEAKVKVKPEAALERLMAGNKRFVADKAEKRVSDAKTRADLAKGQYPFAIILTCADSRVPPEFLFDQGLGDLFVVRVAGNVTGEEVLGSIEYAVAHLQVPLVVVLGHEKCGAVKAALDHEEPEGNLGVLLREVRVGSDLPKDKDKAFTQAIKNNARFHAADLGRRSALLKDFASTGRIQVRAGVYSLTTGEVEWLKEAPAAGR